MAREFRGVDRDSPMLLAPDLRDWLPADHLAWLVIEVVQSCDLSTVVASFKRGGVGRQAYDPVMVATLLLYAYSQGVRSSRAIERACASDVAFMVVSGQQRPDHSTLSRFRAVHAEALAGLFGQVLMVCARAGMGRVGVVSIDGTKIAANASAKRSHTLKHLRRLAAGVLDEAARTDAAEDTLLGAQVSGEELPARLRPGADRAARIAEALAQAEAEEQQRIAADVKAAEQRLERARQAQARREQRAAARSRSRTPSGQLREVSQGQGRVEAAEKKLAQAREGGGYQASRNTVRRNITDPDSRSMSNHSQGFQQGFNAQAAVTDDHLILAFDVTNEASDRALFEPMMQLAVLNTMMFLLGARIGLLLADAGYCSVAALTAAGPDRLIAVGRDPAKPSKIPEVAAMAARLVAGSPDRKRYQRRAATIEPVFGHVKDRIDLRRFSRRGLPAARHEFALAATAHNLRRLRVFRSTQTS